MSRKLAEKTADLVPEVPIARSEVLIDNDTTRITHWTIRPGEQTGWHRHEWDYATYQMSEGRLHSIDVDGNELVIDYQPGVSMAVTAPLEHNASNIGDVDLVALEIEYKH